MPIKTVYDLIIQWLNSQQNPKIITANSPTFINANQGTEMPDIGYDPNWKKQIQINLSDLEGKNTLIRIEATPLDCNVFKIDKLKKSWYNGLFSHLFSLLYQVDQESEKVDASPEVMFFK